jgi:hypothetical protein
VLFERPITSAAYLFDYLCERSSGGEVGGGSSSSVSRNVSSPVGDPISHQNLQRGALNSGILL